MNLRDRVPALAALSALALIFLWPVTVGDKILSQADMLYMYPPWTACRPADLPQASNGLLSDQSMHFYPDRLFARQQLRRGEMPLWNPFILMGTPFLADMVSAVLSPFSVFSYVGDLQRGFGWSALVRLIVAGTGMFSLCRALGVSALGGLLAGISFMLCAFQVVWLNHPQTNVSIFLPWAFLAVQRLVDGRAGALVMLAVVVGAMLLGGHPESVMHVALAAAAFLLYRLAHEGWGKGKRWRVASALVDVGGGALLGAGLAAVALIPFLELLAQSGIWEVRGSFERNPFVLPPSALLTALAPDFFGNPVFGNDGAPLNYNERTLYAGLLPLLLAVVSLRHLRDDGRVRFFVSLGLFCLIIVLGVWPIFDLVTALPVLHHAPNHRLILVLQFCTAALAGIELDWIMRTESASGRSIPERFPYVVAALSVVPLVWWTLRWIGVVALGPVAPRAVLQPLLVGGAVLGLFWLLRQAAISARACGVAACLLTFCDLFTFGYGYNPAVARDRVFACVPDSVGFLQRQAGVFRVAALEWLTLMPNTSMVYALQDARGYDLPAAQHLLPFFTAGLQGFSNGALYTLQGIGGPTPRLLSLANVRYLLSDRDLAGAGLGWPRVYGGEMNIYENPAVLPRAFVVHRVEAAMDGAAALQRVADQSVDLSAVAIVEAQAGAADELQALHDAGPSGAPVGCVDTVEITRYEPREVQLQVELCRPGLVVLTDTYFDGWRADVDGERRHIHRTDYLFRGVYAEPGRHQVRFRYAPLSYRIGLGLSVVSTAAALLLLLRGLSKREAKAR